MERLPTGRIAVAITVCSLAVMGLDVLLAAAQTSSVEATADSSSLPVVTEVRFEGNILFPESKLRTRVRTDPNRRFLNISGFTWWLWLYRLGESGVLGERVGRALMASGEPPAFLDSTVVAADVERLQLFYQQEGFRQARVTAHVDTTQAKQQAQVTFHIEPGEPTYVRRVTYDGLETLSSPQQIRLARGSLLSPDHLDPDAPLRFTAYQQRFSEPLLHEERRRLLTFLRNEGFAAVTRDSVRAIVYPQHPDSFDVTFRVRPGPRYRFGDVHFDVVNTDTPTRPSADTLLLASAQELRPGGITMQVEDEGEIDAALLERTLQFSPGDWYDQSKLLATKRRLEATGVFSFTDISPLRTDTLRTNAQNEPLLPHRVELRTRPRHQVRFETFALQRSGVFAGSDSELGAGIGVSYNNTNLFGGGEAFRVRTSGSIAGDFGAGLLTSTQAEFSTSLTYPYLIEPFAGLERRLGLYAARTRWSLNLLTARRDELKLLIRGRGSARFRLELQHTPTLTSFVDVFDLSLSNPDTLDGFSAVFPEGFFEVGDPVQRAQILQDYTQPQINNALRYTLRSATVNPFRREQGYSYETSVEVGGNVPYLFDRYVFSADTLEGSLPGLPFFRSEGDEDRLAYQQYVRMIADMRRYHPLNEGAVLAWKAIGGFGHPIGQANVIPFDRRFYSGGASSVRGWRLRELGPGDAQFVRAENGTTMSGETNLVGAEIKLEASVEVRQVLFRNVLAANWIGAFFTDAGNVWFGPKNPGFGQQGEEAPDGRFALDSFVEEIGIGSGVGVRLAWEYLIVRLDLAYRVHDPAATHGRFFPQQLNDPVVHFGIGHAF